VFKKLDNGTRIQRMGRIDTDLQFFDTDKLWIVLQISANLSNP